MRKDLPGCLLRNIGMISTEVFLRKVGLEYNDFYRHHKAQEASPKPVVSTIIATTPESAPQEIAP